MSQRVRECFAVSVVPLLAALLLPAADARAGDGGTAASHPSLPSSVTLVGDLQDELGCGGDWQPDCSATQLQYDADDGVWQASFDLPAGSWQYKVALNGSWDLNYGAGGTQNGANIALQLPAAARVRFYFDSHSHWIADDRNAVIAVAPGNFQRALGCASDWDPGCLRSWLQDADGDGVYAFDAWLPAGSYEAKVALNESWDVNYGVDGERNGANIPFSVPSTDSGGHRTYFFYDAASHVLSISLDGTSGDAPEPDSVTLAGSFQDELGCPGDWQPECTATGLQFDAVDGVWQASYAVPAGQWEYKAALNGSWDLNYGANAQRNGANLALSLDAATDVRFYYSHRSNWITSNRNAAIAVAVGNFQWLLGCNGDWDPSCLRSWLQDADGDGVYTFSARLPGGNYEVKVAHDESWALNYGRDGVQNGANIAFSVPDGGAAGTEVFFSYELASHRLSVGLAGLKGDLRKARAHWLDADTLAWNPDAFPAGARVRLHADPDAGLAIDASGVVGGTAFGLTEVGTGLPPELAERFPHLRELRVFRLPALAAETLRPLLQGQLAVSAVDADGVPLDATGVQIPGVLDDLFGYGGALGPGYDADGITLRLWAPTAQAVRVLLFDDPAAAEPAQTLPMQADAASGVWALHGPLDWDRRYYQFEVTVFAPSTGRIETNRVTDPYSLSLAADSTHSQLVDLGAAALKPAGWDALQKPALPAPEDIVLYEVHVRDFSISDDSVPAVQRGRFAAFAQPGSVGAQHLRRLADAGLTHVHLLPAFDFATVPERAEDQREPPADLAAYPADSEYPQAAIAEIKDADGFNWGYDPYHYTVPEGSYATDPDGVARIVEFRDMVQALNRNGLRVVMDVVYNHTSSAGQNPRSVLDKIVPGYYHRLNGDGAIEMSSCCPNTASEHRMMEKLMIDSVLTWARMYKVDGFRFDLMGHHMKSNMLALRAALDALTIEQHGVDGRAIYLYGEGWNFGEVANDARGVNAVQRNMAGTGIGTFNDRLRDGVRGGSPFSGIRDQGFATGLWHDSNGTDQGDERARLLHIADWVRVGLAGTLADYELVDSRGLRVRAAQIDYFGQPAGYTADPQEDISYSAKHDNETLFDAIQLKAAASTPLSERVRMQQLGLSLIALGQGIPFFHAGQEILRSKSLDRDSYNAGDWFNVLDFSLQQHGWGRGLPSAEKNAFHWPLMRTLLADPSLAPNADHMRATRSHFEELLRIRASSPLFRLRSADAVRARLAFHNTGPTQIPGLIVMTLDDAEGAVDRRHTQIVVAINAGTDAVEFPLPAARGALQLHPVQRGSADPRVRTAQFDDGSLFVPARSSAVFVAVRAASERIALLIADVDALEQQGELNADSADSLRAKLRNAERQAAAGQIRAAANMLKAFLNQTAALGGMDAMRREAEEIRRQLLGG